MLKMLLGGLWGGVFGFAGAQFGLAGNWGMVALIIGLIIAFFWLLIWMIDIRYR